MEQKILIVGTGGTIAGMADDAEHPGQYRAAQLSVAALLHSIAGLEKAAQGKLDAIQLAQIDSKDMEDGVWLALLQACDKAMHDDAIRGVVITHGTDTLEETAWFLHCCLGHLPKPVVLTCAMRPANALMPDGPQNLRDAVVAAAARNGRGEPLLRHVVAVTGGGELHGARWVQKVHPHRLLAFSSGEQGLLGWVDSDGVRLRSGSCQAGAVGDACSGEYSGEYRGGEALAQLPVHPGDWPWVEIVSSHAGARAALIDALVAQGVRGLVVATTGNGTVHQALEAALARAHRQGVAVWRSSRCSEGVISPSELPAASDAHHGDFAVALSPCKARISLQLALMGWSSR